MNYLQGDIWKLARAVDVIVIPTCMELNSRGQAIAGAGLAKQAAERVPFFGERLTDLVRAKVCVGFVSIWRGSFVYSFSTKRGWREQSSIALIEESCRALGRALRSWDHETARGRVLLPMVGTGFGGLKWEEVEPHVERLLGKVSNLWVVRYE